MATMIERSALPPVRPLRGSRDSVLAPLVPWLIAALATSALYFGRSLLVPIMLAGLLSFLLAPIAGALRRVGVPRLAGVLIAMLLALGTLGVTSAVLVSQAATLSKDAPAYAQRITEKSQRISSEVRRRFDFVLRESNLGGSGHPETRRNRSRGPERLAGADRQWRAAGRDRDAAADRARTGPRRRRPGAGAARNRADRFIVTLFFLIQKQDLRDRVIRLMGAADLHRTTVAFDDGAKRLSRYFLAQFLVNAGFGAAVWAGLFVLGVPAPGLWGILAGLLRFVPYIGTAIALVGPLLLAAAVDPGWGLVVQVALLFIVIEPIVGYVVEPLVYGRSTGLSPASVVVSALFWTWIWGPVGLVLSMPLTMTLVVLGRHIPAFAVFDILLGDRPALSPAESFYQRVLAGNADEAIDEAEVLLQASDLPTYFDTVVLEALRLAAADVDRGAVRRSALEPVCDATCEVITALALAARRPPRHRRGGGAGDGAVHFRPRTARPGDRHDGGTAAARCRGRCPRDRARTAARGRGGARRRRHRRAVRPGALRRARRGAGPAAAHRHRGALHRLSGGARRVAPCRCADTGAALAYPPAATLAELCRPFETPGEAAAAAAAPHAAAASA